MADIKWTSHRGVHCTHVENTQLSFQAAVSAGFKSLETDLRLTADNEIVLHHDLVMTRTAGIDKSISDLSLNEFKLQKLKDGQCGMSLDDLYRSFSSHRWIFDVKPETGSKTLERLKSWCMDNRAEDWLLDSVKFLLWSSEHDKKLKALFPNAVTLARESGVIELGLVSFWGCPFFLVFNLAGPTRYRLVSSG